MIDVEAVSAAVAPTIAAAAAKAAALPIAFIVPVSVRVVFGSRAGIRPRCQSLFPL